MYRLYLDEVGTNQVKNLDKDRQRYLSLTGVILRKPDIPDLQRKFDTIKNEIFQQDADDPICLHRKEIMGFKGPYEILRNTGVQERFNEAILDVFQTTPYRVITALIDKQWMLGRENWDNKNPYHYLMEIIAEKYVQLLERLDGSGDIMPEARSSKDNKLLQLAFDYTMQNGTYYISRARFDYRIRSKNLKFRTKKHNIAGLQLCDLLAHPSHIYIRSVMGHDVTLGPFARRIGDILLRQKYDRNPNTQRVRGYGYKHMP